MHDLVEDPLVNSGTRLDDLDDIPKEIIDEPKSKFDKTKIVVLALIAAITISIICVVALSKSGYGVSNSEGEELPDCKVYDSFFCKKWEQYHMSEEFENLSWATPERGEKGWIPGFQDMSTLVGYAQQKYESGLKQCTVTVITRTKKNLKLKYIFDGVEQESNVKVYDDSYKGILKIRVVAETGESLNLEDVDFIWNVQPLKQRDGDYRDGKKGAIVELFGWPDEDIEKECKNIAEAGYLGIKIFPHQEQVMSYQQFEHELNPWYFMYQPVSYRLQGRMGTRNQLRKMINTCRGYGLRVYHDAVINHMSGSGNDMGDHRNPQSGCSKWGNKTTSATTDMGSPYYTPTYTYKEKQRVIEFPAVPYSTGDFHCDKAVNAWDNGHVMATGWLSGLVDLDTSKEYVQQRIADYFVDMLSIGFTGFRIDAAKHIHPKDIAEIFGKFKKSIGGSLPVDFMTYLEVITGGESQIVLGEGDYSYTSGLTQHLKNNGLDDREIETIKIWWCNYPERPDYWGQYLPNSRKAIQNDDHDQQNDGSTSRDMHDKGCVLVSKKCSIDDHRRFEVKLFQNPEGTSDNDNDFPIRLVLSSYWFVETSGGKTMSPPDGKSECSLCTTTCDGCKGRGKVQAYQENAKAYEGNDYTRVHRDTAIINAMRAWMKLPSI